MPKNAVQRLQKIESDLKTVISIYNITNEPKRKHDKPDTPKNSTHFSDISTQKHFPDISNTKTKTHTDRTELSNKCQKPQSQSKPSVLYYWKKIGSINAQTPQGVHIGESGVRKKKWKPKKPGSAPTSSSTLSIICESDYIQQPSSESIHEVFEKSILSKAKTSDNLKRFGDPNNASVHEMLMTPSKTLQTAYEILAKSNFQENEEFEDAESLSYKSVSCSKVKEPEDTESPGKHEVDHPLNVKTIHSLKRNSSFNIKKIKEQLENHHAVVERSRSLSPKKERFPTSKSQEVAKNSADSKKNKSTLEISPKYNTIPKKIPRLEISIPDNSDKKNGTKVQGEIKNFPEKSTKSGSDKLEKDERSTKKDNDDGSSGNKYSKEVKLKSPVRSNVRAKLEKFVNGTCYEKKNQTTIEKNGKMTGALLDSSNQQKPTKNLEANQEMWIKEFAALIEISNEKLEKMKVSKELALDIAKHLKTKYDEIQHAKEELMEKVQKVEKENERLSNEVKNVHESKMKLQLKIEELKKDSKTKAMEQETKVKDILSENTGLKTKFCELQIQYNEELFKKQKDMEQIRKERLAEIRKEIKSREDEVQQLRNEKSELQSHLNDRDFKIKILDEKICQLQEEIQKQKQHLKKKTDRLEETNKELESIRQNSGDLEEQVKMLRKNIENFDQMQQNLMKKTSDYDQQLKSKQEEIAKLQDENSRLKEENSKLKIELENEKDALLIKTKIIEDQQETIRQCRDKSDETRTLMKRNQSLERMLNIEREEKLELQDAVERLKWRKDELKKKVKILENDLLLAPQEVVRDLQKTQLVLHELENQVQVKQKEWELQFQSLLREKEQACSAAEFATKKLMQTTAEFQKQNQAHKRLHRILAENLAEKEKNLREVNEKKYYTQSKLCLSHVRPDDKINWMKDRPLSTMRDDDDAIMDWYFNNSSCCHEASKNKSSPHFS